MSKVEDEEQQESDIVQPTPPSQANEKRSVPISDIYMREVSSTSSEDRDERSIPAKLFTFSRVILYLLLGLWVLKPIMNFQKAASFSQAMLPIVIYPLLILLHKRLVDKVESELANNKDFLLGGILLFFISVAILVLSLIAPVPFILLRALGILISIIHLLYGVEVLQRYK